VKKLIYLLLLSPIIYLVSCGKANITPQSQTLEDIIVGTEWCLSNENEDGFLLSEDGNLYITEKCQPNISIGEWIIDGDIIKFVNIQNSQEITVVWAQISEYSDTVVKLFDVNDSTLTVVSVYQLDYEDIFGCTDSTALNYNPNAECLNEECIYVSLGCTDSTACNYDLLANTDDGCIFPDGCTDFNAINYNPSALCDDGTCTYDSDYCIYCDLVYQGYWELEFYIGELCGDEITQLYSNDYYEVLEIIISGNDTLKPGIYGPGSVNSEYEIHCGTHAQHKIKQ
jgi:hypothetical protein